MKMLGYSNHRLRQFAHASFGLRLKFCFRLQSTPFASILHYMWHLVSIKDKYRDDRSRQFYSPARLSAIVCLFLPFTVLSAEIHSISTCRPIRVKSRRRRQRCRSYSVILTILTVAAGHSDTQKQGSCHVGSSLSLTNYKLE